MVVGSVTTPNFNPRSHEGSDELMSLSADVAMSFQSTLPRGERRYMTLQKLLNRIISIHAPTRGATNFNRHQNPSRLYFNPRSHEGSDRERDVLHLFLCISIHAPTRGATTVADYERQGTEKISIHAPTRGATATLTNFFFYNQSIFC